MAETKRMTVEEVVSYLLEEGCADFLRESLRWVVQQLMEAEVSGSSEPSTANAPKTAPPTETATDPAAGTTRAGELELAIPKLRKGSYFPRFLSPRKRAEQALVAVVQEAYVAGFSTRKVDQVVESLGLRVSKSEVSRICQGLDEQVRPSVGARSRAAIPTSSSTPRSSASETAAVSLESGSWSPMACTSRGVGR